MFSIHSAYFDRLCPSRQDPEILPFFPFCSFFTFSMNKQQIADLSYSISYWNNSELEEKLASVFPSLLSCSDDLDTQRQTLLVIQQIKNRFKQSSVIFVDVDSL